MAFNLISCNSLYPDILDIALPDFTSYDGLIVTIGNDTQSYTVESNGDPGTLDLGAITITEVEACVPCVGFTPVVSLDSDSCACSGITITDESVYVNSIPGHDTWGYRKIVVTDPDGLEFVFSSIASEADQLITPYSGVSVNEFLYSFTDNSNDGVYDVILYTFPEWDSAVTYNSTLGQIVHKNGKLYKIVSTHTNQDPELDTIEAYWELYEIDDSTLTTRYARQNKIVILCISLLQCKEDLIKDAFCGVRSNPCVSMCKNDKFQNAMKFVLTQKAIEISKCQKDWASVKKQIDILKSICNCGGSN